MCNPIKCSDPTSCVIQLSVVTPHRTTTFQFPRIDPTNAWGCTVMQYIQLLLLMQQAPSSHWNSGKCD